MVNLEKDRRLKRYLLSSELLAQIFRGRVCVEGENLPDDAFVVHVGWENEYLSLSVCVWSSQFEPVLPHSVIPYGGPVTLRVYEDPRQTAAPDATTKRGYEFL